ncbi:MAG TPA: hypothetical protein VGN44_13275 [Candidatus Angelobacter sp.]|jgi:hypothetical protein
MQSVNDTFDNTSPLNGSLCINRILVGLRSRVLRMSGYEVEETFTVEKASESAQSDLIDALVICHTVPEEEKEQLVSAVRKTRKLMPILCIRAHQHDLLPSDCVSVENSPVAMLDSVREAIQPYKAPKASRILLAS